ncbi:MAG: biotin--[acetyl-CoA-carboxylase] ligase [Pseudomonadota bacterium]
MSAELTNLSKEKQRMEHILLKPLLSEAIIERLIDLGVRDITKLSIFSSLESTNDYLLSEVNNFNEVYVCLAEQQTHGRGRYGHQWISPPGCNIYLSMLWPISKRQMQYDLLSLWLLLAIADVLTTYDIKDIQLKWPNDICVADKKLAGVLVEQKLGQTNSNLVIGVGLNVAMSKQSSTELDRPWIDLHIIKPDITYSRNEIAADLLAKFHQTIRDFEDGRLRNLPAKWHHYDMLLDQHIHFLKNERIQEGIVKGVDDAGNLIIDLDGNIEHFHSADVREIKLN